MSGVEALFVLGLIANILGVVDVTGKALDRMKEVCFFGANVAILGFCTAIRLRPHGLTLAIFPSVISFDFLKQRC